MLSLGELIAELGIEAVAAPHRLDRPVRWVHISELTDPTPWLSGGELVLTTGLLLEDEPTQRDYVGRLAGAGLSGLGIGTGIAHERVPEAILHSAAELDFPVLEIPYDVPFIAVTEKAATHLVNEHYTVLQRASAAHERLERVVLSEGGLPGLAAELAELVAGGAAVIDQRGDVLAAAGSLQGDVLADLAAEAGRRRSRGRDWVPGGELHGRSIALAVEAPGAGRTGSSGPWLVAARDAGPLGELDRLVARQAVTVVGLELLRARMARETERRLAGDILSALAAGELEGRELARRLQPFGLRGQVAAVLFAPSRSHRAAVDDALARAVEAEGAAGLVAGLDGLVCALVPAPREGGEEALFAQAEALRAAASSAAGSPQPAGAGRAVGAGELRRSFHEARCALEARALTAAGDDGTAALATYRDLGSFQLLLSLQDDDALRLFCDSILSPIESSEGAYGGELMRSLEAFIECNGQWERAARQLYCHRHTLRYRIRRVEELTGRSLDSARDRIDFWLALRGRELVR